MFESILSRHVISTSLLDTCYTGQSLPQRVAAISCNKMLQRLAYSIT